MYCRLCSQEPEFTDSKVQAMKEYEYRVTAENDGGESEPSDCSKPIKAKPLKGISLLLYPSAVAVRMHLTVLRLSPLYIILSQNPQSNLSLRSPR